MQEKYFLQYPWKCYMIIIRISSTETVDLIKEQCTQKGQFFVFYTITEKERKKHYESSHCLLTNILQIIFFCV